MCKFMFMTCLFNTHNVSIYSDMHIYMQSLSLSLYIYAQTASVKVPPSLSLSLSLSPCVFYEDLITRTCRTRKNQHF